MKMFFRDFSSLGNAAFALSYRDNVYTKPVTKVMATLGCSASLDIFSSMVNIWRS